MELGRKKHYIRIEEPVQVKDADTGAVTTSWILFKNMWASVETMRSFIKQAAQASWPGADVEISIDYVEDLLPTFRIVYKDKIYSILNANNLDEMDRDYILTCQTGVKGI